MSSSRASRAAGKRTVTEPATTSKPKTFRKQSFAPPKAGCSPNSRHDQSNRIFAKSFLPTYPKDCQHGDEGQPTQGMYMRLLTAYEDRSWVKDDLNLKFVLDGQSKYFPGNKAEGVLPYHQLPVISPEHVRAPCSTHSPSQYPIPSCVRR